MFLARRLLRLAAAVLATMAFTGGSASAKFEFMAEAGTSHCSSISVVGHEVSGGCNLEFASIANIPLHAYIPGKVTISNCEWYVRASLDESGEGYVNEVILDPPHDGTVPCTRTACDEVEVADATHPIIAWPFHLREHGAGGEELEMEFCLRLTSAAEGTSGAWCDIHLEFRSIGAHTNELGRLDAPADPAEVFCENNPGTGYPGPHALTPAPTSIEPHLQTIGTDSFEFFH